MAVVRAQKTEMPEPYQLEAINKKILVMGGGIAGITAATEASKAGYEVTLVEKEGKLGGKANGWRKQCHASDDGRTQSIVPTNHGRSLSAQVQLTRRTGVQHRFRWARQVLEE